MSTNNNNVAVGRGWNANAYYLASDLGAFNAVNAADGSFCAYATVVLRGGLQTFGGGALLPQHIWGNFDSVSQTGWSIALAPTAGPTLVAIASLGTGGGTTAASRTLVSTTAPLTPIGQLLMLGMWFDGTNLILTANGVVIGTATPGALMAPSPLFATLGAGNAVVPENPAAFVDVVSAGFFNELSFGALPGLPEDYAALSFQAAQAGYGSNYMFPSAGFDWTHRYAFNRAGSATQGVIEKTAQGARLLTQPAAPLSLSDLGGLGVSNPNRASFVAAPLARAGNLAPVVTALQNPTWHSFGSFQDV